MGRNRLLRAVKLCKICGEGYDAFKARDARGRYCSPACLAEARRRHRDGMSIDGVAVSDDNIAEREAVLSDVLVPQLINLGSRTSVVNIGLDVTLHRGC